MNFEESMTSIGRFAGVLLLLSTLAATGAAASTVACVSLAVPAVVRAEGLAERVGDIVLNCTGAAGSAVSTNLTVFLSRRITNRISETGVADVLLTVDNGSGPVSAGVPATLGGPSSVNFLGAAFNLSSAGQATVRISNLRAAIGEIGSALPVPVQAFLSFGGPVGIAINSAPITVATPVTGLLAGPGSSSVPCVGSRLPEQINFSSLLSTGTQVFSTRATEGFGSAFQPRGPMEDSGTRILLRYSGFPAGARLFVPDVVAGSNAVQPTIGGDLGGTPSGGQYSPGGSGSLLLVRIVNGDPTGAGGMPVYTPGAPGSGTVSLNGASEVPLSGGSGFAVYEVFDADAALRENAQIPTFLGLPATAQGAVAKQEVSFAPVSTLDAASRTAPVPRFIATLPPQDCTTLGDCRVFPQLLVDAPPLEYEAQSGSGHQVRYVRVLNDGGGFLNWAVKVEYKNGSGWLRIFPDSGARNATVRVDALPQALAPGKYEATVTIDAGALAGSRALPVTLNVTPAPPPEKPPVVELPAAAPAPVIESISNGASLIPGPLVAGSRATVRGLRLAGREVSVTFDGEPASLLSNSGEQIDVLVPAALSGRGWVRLLVTVDGVAGAPRAVQIAPVWPAIFPNGVLNQDGSPNSALNPAAAGSVVQIFLTGLAGKVTAKIHDREITDPDYAGPAPGYAGVQQVNLPVPSDLPAMTTEVVVCGAAESHPDLPVCTRPASITLR
jgi:uncharacterized protein (TIGR03437 family)